MQKRARFIAHIGLMVCVILGMLAAAQPARAATYVVCLTGICNYHSITDAVAAAHDGDTITVIAGTYHEHNITINANFGIHGAGSSQVAVDGGNINHVFVVSPGKNVSISGMAIMHGTSGSLGGGIYNDGNLTLDDVLITENTSGEAGSGIYSSAILNMTNSQVINNTAPDNAAGILLIAGSTTHLTNVLIQNNTITSSSGYDGGGILVSGFSGEVTSLFLDQSTIDHNTAAHYGGGIAAKSHATVTITNSTISNNASGAGAGLYADSTSALMMTNATVTGNNANPTAGVGGGIDMDGSATLTNVTVAGNSADGGGGILNYGGTVNLADTIISGNTAHSDADCYGAIHSLDNNLIENTTDCTFTGATNHNITGKSAKLGVLVNNGGPTQTMALLTGSPAIGAGNNSTCASTDQRGVTRPQGAHCDIGAYELDTTRPTVVSSVRAGSSPTNAASVDFTVTFSEAVTNVDSSDFILTTTGISGALVTAINGSGATRTVTVNTGTGTGDLRLDVFAGATITDIAGNLLSGLPYNSGQSYTIDKTQPTVVSSVRAGSSPTHAASVDFTVTFSEAVTNVDKSDFTLSTNGLTGAMVTAVNGSGATRTVTVNTGTGTGDLRLNVFADATITDIAGNLLSGLPYNSGQIYTIDKTPPTVDSIVRTNGNPSNLGSVEFTVTFSEVVTGVDVFGFTPTTTGAITGVYISGVTGSGVTYTVTVNTGVGNGTLRLDVPTSATITDQAGNLLANLPYTGGEMYSITKTHPIFLPVILR